MALTVNDAELQLDNFFQKIVDQVGGDVLGKALPLLGKLSDMADAAGAHDLATALDPFGPLKLAVHNAMESAKQAIASNPMLDPGTAIADAISHAGIPGVVSATWNAST